MIDRSGAEAHLRVRLLLRQRLGQRRGLLVLQLGGGSRHAGVVDAVSQAEHALLGGPIQATYCCGLDVAGLTRGGAVPRERRPGAVRAFVTACKEPRPPAWISYKPNQIHKFGTSHWPQCSADAGHCVGKDTKGYWVEEWRHTFAVSDIDIRCVGWVNGSVV